MTPPTTPTLVVLDVNETLSDLAPMTAAFEQAGLPGFGVEGWFSGVLRDGFALTCVGENPSFAELAVDGLRQRLGDADDAGTAVEQVMSAFTSLPVHADVAGGLRRLREHGIRVVTLSNGSASVARGLLERAGLLDLVEALLSVEDAGSWKPHAAAYEHALRATGTPAGQAMLVAVHPWDVDGALRAGLQAGWVDRRGVPYPTTFLGPTVQAPDLVSLADRLAGLEAPRVGS